MSIDFCSPHLKPRIYSDKVSVDGYEITNLISEDYFQKTKGFLAERFIKPPVLVTIAFPLNIDIEKIVINPIVGSQKTCGFEIMTRSDVRKDSWILDNVPQEMEPHSKGIFVRIGRCIQQFSEQSVFVFTNRSYRPKPAFSKLTTPSEGLAGYNVIHSELRYFRSVSYTNVSHVLIRITQTFGGCIPCLKSLSVYGQPANSVPRNILGALFQLQDSYLCQLASPTDSVAVKEVKGSESGNPDSDEDIPSEFLDPITCDIMSLPMLLPSGQTVSKETLDKHITEEARWGRPPNDPFTGVAFQGRSRPVPNSALKARIDQFLVKSGRKFQNVARTVGKASDLLNRNVDIKSVYGNMEHKTENLGTRPKHEPDSLCVERFVVNSDQVGIMSKTHSILSRGWKRSSIDSNVGKAKYRKLDNPPSTCGLQSEVSSSGMTNLKPDHPNLSGGVSQPHIKTHEENLSSSLDIALCSTLASLPSYRNMHSKSRVSVSVTNLKSCVQCNMDLKCGLYNLQCGHCLCRDCLISVTKDSNEVVCKSCQTVSFSKDIKKIYLT